MGLATGIPLKKTFPASLPQSIIVVLDQYGELTLTTIRRALTNIQLFGADVVKLHSTVRQYEDPRVCSNSHRRGTGNRRENLKSSAGERMQSK